MLQHITLNHLGLHLAINEIIPNADVLSSLNFPDDFDGIMVCVCQYQTVCMLQNISKMCIPQKIIESLRFIFNV